MVFLAVLEGKVLFRKSNKRNSFLFSASTVCGIVRIHKTTDKHQSAWFRVFCDHIQDRSILILRRRNYSPEISPFN